jgi:hypothetical protein
MKKQNYLNQIIKALLIMLVLGAAIAGIGYGAFYLYHFAIETYHAAVDDATQRIKSGVSSGVQEGMGKSLNPVRMVKGVFGMGRSRSSNQQ